MCDIRPDENVEMRSFTNHKVRIIGSRGGGVYCTRVLTKSYGYIYNGRETKKPYGYIAGKFHGI